MVPGPPLGGTAPPPPKGYLPPKFSKSLALKKYITFKFSSLP